MRITDLRGRRVIELKTARTRGTVAEILIDPSSGRVAAVDLAPVAGEGRELFLTAAISRIGHSAIMLTRSASPEPGQDACRGRERLLDTSSLIGLEVLGEDGDRVGYVSNAIFEPESLQISAFTLKGAAWRRWLGHKVEIAPDEVAAWSPELMLVRRERLESPRTPG